MSNSDEYVRRLIGLLPGYTGQCPHNPKMKGSWADLNGSADRTSELLQRLNMHDDVDIYREIAQKRLRAYDDELVRNEARLRDWSRGNPFYLLILEERCMTIIKNGKDLLGEDFSIGSYGVSSIASPHASTYPIPDTDKSIIIFNSGFFHLFNCVCRAVASVHLQLPVEEYENLLRGLNVRDDERFKNYLLKLKVLVSDIIKKDNAIIDDCANAFSSVIFDYPQKSDAPILSNFFLEELKSIMLLGVELFICAHEIAHVHHGHNGLDSKKTHVLLGKERLQKIKHAWGQEWIADLTGQHLAFKSIVKIARLTANPSFFDIAMSGPEIFFATIHYLYEALSFLIGEEYNICSDTHPPPIVRCDMLRLYRSRTGQSGYGHLDGALLRGAEFFTTISVISQHVVPVLFEQVANGAQISGLWFMEN